jgi:hypothetical protein
MALCLAALLLTSDKAAAAPFAISGTYVHTAPEVATDIVPRGHPDCSCVFSYNSVNRTALSGSMTGAGTDTASCVIRYDVGSGVCEGTFVFEGTIAGRTGTATFHIVTHFDPTGTRSSLSAISGTGGLADLHGHFESGDVAYEGQFVFAPR